MSARTAMEDLQRESACTAAADQEQAKKKVG